MTERVNETPEEKILDDPDNGTKMIMNQAGFKIDPYLKES
jgi:hypothetical protein